MKPEEMSDEELVSNRTIVSTALRPDGQYDAIMSCGHQSIFVGNVKTGVATPCFQCASIMVRRNDKWLYLFNTLAFDTFLELARMPIWMLEDLLNKVLKARTGSQD
jgi:hypothetical protein